MCFSYAVGDRLVGAVVAVKEIQQIREERLFLTGAAAVKDVQVEVVDGRGRAVKGMIQVEVEAALAVEYISPDGSTRYQGRPSPFTLTVPMPESRPKDQVRVSVEPHVINRNFSGGTLTVSLLYRLTLVLLREELLPPYPDGFILAGRRFINRTSTVLTGDGFLPVLAEPVEELSVFGYCVWNRSPINTALVRLELSPDGFLWLPEPAEKLIPPGGAAILVPQHFLRFVRLQCRSAHPGRPAELTVWFQGQV